MKTKSMKLFAVLVMIAMLPLMSFTNRHEKMADYYVYLKYEMYDKNNTQYLFVSDVINYQDWQDNSIELRKKFAAKAIEQSGMEVWQPGIKHDGIAENIDDVKTTREKSVQSFKSWHEGYNRKVVIYRINLYRL
jgi:hypothetical protein